MFNPTNNCVFTLLFCFETLLSMMIEKKVHIRSLELSTTSEEWAWDYYIKIQNELTLIT